MSVLVRDIVTAVSHGEAALVGESCGYLVLGAADQVQHAPRAVHFDSLSVTSDGALQLDAAACSAIEAEQSLRVLLGQLLRFVRTPCPNLRRVADRNESKGLHTLVLELEAALVPVNRRAARRSLSRLVRETARSQAQLRARAQVEEVEATAHGVAPELGPLDESPTASACMVLTQPTSVLGAPPEVQAAAALPWQNSESEAWMGVVPDSGASGWAQTAVQTVEPKRAESGAESGAWATLMASQFVEPTPAPFESAPAEPLGETDVFDALLDECPTQVFQGAVVERASVQASTPGLHAAQFAPKRTLTPPPPLQDAGFDHPSSQDAPQQPRNGWTSLVTRPTDDPLILSPCPPSVVPATAEVETPRLVNLVASLETPMVAEVAVEPPEMGEIDPVQEPAPTPARRPQPFYRYRARPRAPLAAHISLLPEAEPPAPRSPSEIEQLLNRFTPGDRPQDVLFEQLQNLSRVDLTPPAALVMSLQSND